MTTMPQEFGVSIEQDDARVEVRVSGEIDLAAAPYLRQLLDAVIDAGTGDVDVDLSSVTFLDSSGLAALLAARQRLLETPRRFRVLHPSRPAYRVLELSGLLEVLEVTLNQATAAE